MFTIDKQFSFCYGHRVWSQTLNKNFTEKGDNNTKCRFLHGHEATVHVFLESEGLESGMVTDFKHLGWLNTFLNDNLDHKFIIDINDPWFVNITGLQPVFGKYEKDPDVTVLSHFLPHRPFNTTDETQLVAKRVFVPGETDKQVGYKADIFEMAGPEREVLEGFFFVTFLPTSENLSKWIFKIAQRKMAGLNVRVSRVDWYETPKSRSSYAE